ncbi:helix-turn-helix transcriptional regulator [Flavobacterium sp. CYK-4]|uniref:helix-turn-helix domain-containing protein n=1 Tax=Flavobacterium lotistagni TaxID=2709660 RepID=UPI0014088EDF|nr:AraC family transcriptional regulator [Flavobacterium lotistagni]NHM06189.1 helix-turn-helix transcriptional regulator [Flavobacterium lotistagni]
MLFVLGISISLFLCFLLVFKQSKSRADYILAAWLFVIFAHLALFKIHDALRADYFSYLYGIEAPLPFLHGPLLYLYLAALTNHFPVGRYRFLIHFMPFLFSYLTMIPFFCLSAQEKEYIYRHDGIGYEDFVFYSSIFINISGVYYVFRSIVLLRRHRKDILHQFSDIDRINLQWMTGLIIGIGAIWIAVLFGNDQQVFALAVFVVLYIGYFGINQVRIFGNAVITQSTTMTSNVSQVTATLEEVSQENKLHENVKYAKTGLKKEAAMKIVQALDQLMDQEHLYRDTYLKISDLALKLDIHPNVLSQAINEYKNQNFYDYINTLRINEFISLIGRPENQKYTMMSLAYDCGFNSKSSFNRHFKRVTGKTPTEYVGQAIPE